MALLPVHTVFSLNGAIVPCSAFVESENEGGIYEVLRVEQGVPLFLDEHLNRFYHSAQIAQQTIGFQAGEIARFITALIRANEVDSGNILISWKEKLKAFFIPHYYPGPQQYAEGVVCGVLHAERNAPNAKVFQTDVRKKANAMIERLGVYEVVLVDRTGKITEGSRSNLFFIRNKQLVTPLSDKVLLGITRQKTLECARGLALEVVEEDIALNSLANFDAAFITGTSPKILPIKQIGDIEFRVDNLLLRKLMQQHDALISDYIACHRQA